MRSRLEGADIDGCQMIRMRYTTGTLADAATSVNLNMPQVLSMTPTATRVVTLPAVTAADNGKFFYLVNLAAATHAMTINNAAASGIGSLAATENGMAMVVEGAWVLMMVGTST